MRVEAYVQARYGRLLEYAVELGAPEGQAAEYVDEVLLTNRRRIRRTADPDPMVRDELARAIAGRTRHSRDWVAVAVVLALVAAVGLSALLFRPDRTPVPSLFGYRGEQGENLLRDADFDVVVRPARACEPLGQVLGTSPAAGSLLRPGASVEVRVAVPSSDCQATYLQRTTAWDFVAFARGLSAPPPLADQVRVVVDGTLEHTLTGAEALDRRTWGRALRLVADTAATPAPTTGGIARLSVDQTTPPPSWCGIARPASVGDRMALQIQIDTAPDDGSTNCPLTLDLYRSDDSDVLDTLVVYTAND